MKDHSKSDEKHHKKTTTAHIKEFEHKDAHVKHFDHPQTEDLRYAHKDHEYYEAH